MQALRDPTNFLMSKDISPLGIAFQSLVVMEDLDVDVMMADLCGVNVHPAGLGECQEGAEAQQVDCGDQGKHSCPRACGLDEIPREVHH